MRELTCPKCGKVFSSGSAESDILTPCPNCGSVIIPFKTCPGCGKPIDIYKAKRGIFACSYCDKEFRVQVDQSGLEFKPPPIETLKPPKSHNPSEETSKKLYKIWSSVGIVFALLVLGYICTLFLPTMPLSESDANVPMPAPTEFVFKPENYRTDITYEQLSRTPDEYTGEFIAVSGTVVQVMEETDTVYLRLGTGEWYNEIYYIEYPKNLLSVRVLENDELTIYGEYVGLYEYNTVFGQQVIVPAIDAEHIDISNAGE